MNLPHATKPFFNVEALREIQKERLDLGIKKNHDYGGTMDAILIGGIEGLATRLLDKAARLHSLVQPGMEALVTDESIRDTLLDMGNYSDYGVSVLDQTWGQKPIQLHAMRLPTEEEKALAAMYNKLKPGQIKQDRVSFDWFAKSQFGMENFYVGLSLCGLLASSLKAKQFTCIQTSKEAKEYAKKYALLK